MKKYKLGEICTIVPGYAFKATDFGKGLNYVIKIKDIMPPYIDILHSEKVETVIDKKYEIKYGDFVMAMTGATIGKIGKLQIDSESKIYINQRVCKFIPEAFCDKEYLYYKLNTQEFQRFIYNNVDNKLAQPNIGHPTIYKYELELPLLSEQRRIGQFLKAIDDKIALNRSINHNLETMAKQLYDYWFVQFDFPDENGKPYKSSGGKMVWNEKLKREIPKDWCTAGIFDELSVQYGFPFSTELFTETPTNIPIVRIRDIVENSISAYSSEKTDIKYKLQKQDLLIGMDGNFHMNYWNDNISYLNQRSVRLRAKISSTVSILQARFDIAPYIKAKELRAKGSTVGHLSDKDLKDLYVLVSPNHQIRKIFDNLLVKIIENRCETTALSTLRDSLLPLLMNGQVSVNYDLSNNLPMQQPRLAAHFPLTSKSSPSPACRGENKRVYDPEPRRLCDPLTSRIV